MDDASQRHGNSGYGAPTAPGVGQALPPAATPGWHPAGLAPSHPPLAPGGLRPLAPLAPPSGLRPPARHARRIALVLSATAVAFSLGFGFFLRRAYALRDLRETDPETFMIPIGIALSLLLVALLLRMVAAICELLWLERTWSNLPEALRKVGPVDRVSSGMMIGISFVPGVAWLWKLGVVLGAIDGLEQLRAQLPFRAPLPRRLGTAAVVTGWIPGLNVYVAPFLWELFAVRMDAAIVELSTMIGAAPPPTSASPSESRSA